MVYKKKRKGRKSKQAMITALEENLGIVSVAAKKCGISRNRHYEWLAEDKEYEDIIREMENKVLDFAEAKLYQLVEAENPQAIMFLLKTRGKKRGYGEKEIQVNTQVNIQNNKIGAIWDLKKLQEMTDEEVEAL